MAKDNERKVAAVMYIEQNKTAKEIAARLSVSENTVGKWVSEGNWKDRQLAYQTSGDELVKSLKELLQSLVDERLTLQSNPEYDKKEAARLSDEISKASKTIETAQKESRIPLSTYIKVMELVFQDLQRKHPKIYLQLIDFQESHISHVAKQYE